MKNSAYTPFYTQGVIYNWFEVGIPILGTPNLGAQIQER